MRLFLSRLISIGENHPFPTLWLRARPASINGLPTAIGAAEVSQWALPSLFVFHSQLLMRRFEPDHAFKIMSLSWNEDSFPDPWSCIYWNQSIIYISGSDTEPNCWCNATIKADPDIAGIGVSV